MPTTITAFYDFTAGGKARAAEVDANFSNFRGTYLPINEDTATASNNSHDLGSTEHRWRRGYFTDFLDFTGTADIKLSGTTVAAFSSDGINRSTFGTIKDTYSALWSGNATTIGAWSTLSANAFVNLQTDGKTKYLITLAWQTSTTQVVIRAPIRLGLYIDNSLTAYHRITGMDSVVPFNFFQFIYHPGATSTTKIEFRSYHETILTNTALQIDDVKMHVIPL